MGIMEAGTVLEKRLFVVDIRLTMVATIDAKQFGRFFVLAFLLNETEWLASDLRKAVTKMIERGARYLLFHGARCEEAEWIADQLCVERLGDRETARNVILTTSHPDQTLSDFLEQATMSSCPAEDYIAHWEASVFLCLAGPKQALAVADLLR